MAYIMATRTVRGFVLGECVSAFQKSVRRCDEDGAVCWAVEIDQSGFGAMLWSRMLVIASEDIGLAEPGLFAEIRALYDTWKEFKARKNPNLPERLFVMHAVMLLARAKKSRRVDVAISGSYCVEEPICAEIPDYALDGHTQKGRAMGRGQDFWNEHAVVLVNEADLGDDPWPARREKQKAEMGKIQGLEFRKNGHGSSGATKAKTLTQEVKEAQEAELEEAIERAKAADDGELPLGLDT